MAEKTTAITTRKQPQMDKVTIRYQGEAVVITKQDVINHICPKATEQEVMFFLHQCKALQLNPWAGEIFLIKYDEGDKAATVIALDSYLKAAEGNPQYDGHEAGIILQKESGGLEERQGIFLTDAERRYLVGGWAKIYRKDRTHPYYIAVNKTDVIRLKRDGSPTRFWSIANQALMLRKTALKRGLHEAFTSLFAGTVADVEIMDEPIREVGETATKQLPAAFKKESEPDWDKFFARAKDELGLDAVGIHQLTDVLSIKAWMEKEGKTLEDFWNLLVAKVLEKGKPAEVEWEQINTGTDTTPKVEGAPSEPATTRQPSNLEAVKQPCNLEAIKRPTRDVEAIKSLNNLYQACNQDFGLQPAQVVKELGYKSQREITETPKDAYLKIRATMSGPK